MKTFTIQTTVNPDKDLLILARSLITTNTALTEAFIEARGHENQLTTIVNKCLATLYYLVSEVTPSYQLSQVRDVLVYLAEEATQVPEGASVVLDEKGQALAVITEEDFMEPHLVERSDFNEEGIETGTRLALALPTLKPEVSAAITMSRYAMGEQKAILDAAAQRRPNLTVIQAQTLTSKGRRAFAEQLPTDAQEYLKAPGAWKRFYAFFTPGVPVDPTDFIVIPMVLGSRKVFNVVDHKGLNLDYNHLSAVRGNAVWGWLRSLACYLESYIANDERVTVIPAQGFRPDPEYFWVGSFNDIYREGEPQTQNSFSALMQHVLKIKQGETLGYLDILGDVKPDTYEEARAWSITTAVSANLYLRTDYHDVVSLVQIANTVYQAMLDL